MGDISPHFSRREFTCKDGCGFDTIDVETIAILEQVRRHFGAPITVHSGARCPVHNKEVGGASHSQHLIGRAADIEVRGVNPSVVASYLEASFPNSYGIGRYRTFTHVDSRQAKARWSG